MDVGDRVRDSLPVNLPYDGLVAEAYDTWLPPDREYQDRAFYRDAIEQGGGPALELGCGNGRLLVGFRAAGLDVEGVDSSYDMLAICAGHARDAGVDLTLHLADWTELGLERRYATIYNPAGSFMLIDDEDVARRALTAWLAHLAPGGRLYVGGGVPWADFDEGWGWRIRRSATRPRDGVTFMVHEAVHCDLDDQLQHVINRHEVWDAEGTLVTTFLRRHRMRWLTGGQMESLLRECGAKHVRMIGTDDEYVAIGWID
jgi:SAM-dependent methyltransferase